MTKYDTLPINSLMQKMEITMWKKILVSRSTTEGRLKRRKSSIDKKNLYTNEDNNSSDDSDSETNEIVFMGLETQTDGKTVSTEEDDPNKEVEVDFEAKFFCTIEEIVRLEERNRT